MVDSKEKFVGCFIGDHAKTGIGTMINTGSTIGVAANIFGGFAPKFAPSFSWGPRATYDLQKAIDTAGAVMWRRGIKLTDEDANLLRQVFKLTVSERKRSA
jgi:hypothetical protein